jgi:hypothetical protein
MVFSFQDHVLVARRFGTHMNVPIDAAKFNRPSQ